MSTKKPPPTEDQIAGARNWWAGQIIWHNQATEHLPNPHTPCTDCEAIRQAGVAFRAIDALVAERDRLREDLALAERFLGGGLTDAMYDLREFDWEKVEQFLRRGEVPQEEP